MPYETTVITHLLSITYNIVHGRFCDILRQSSGGLTNVDSGSFGRCPIRLQRSVGNFLAPSTFAIAFSTHSFVRGLRVVRRAEAV